MDLYSYCDGDPVNQYDADGRFGVGALTGQSYNSASSLGAIFGGSTLITQSTQMASSLVQSYQGNLQMFDGNQYDAINATVNPAYTAISKYNEAADGIGYSYNNLGNSLSTSQRVFSGFQSAVGAVSTVGAGFAGASLLDGALSVASGGVPASYFQSTRLEVQALQQQGLSTSEAFSQIRSFNAGNADGYSFHFTTAQKAQGILNDGFIKPSTGGVYGSGVYAGTTPTPGFLLKNTPFAGWGLGGEGANVRIPFQTVQQPVVPPLPPQTVIFRNPVKIGE
jgi:hypothetical protein